METSTARAINDPAAEFYIDALRKLQATNIPFLLGGAFAFSHYAHVPRDTKDIDVFVKPEDCPRVLAAFNELGYETEVPLPALAGKDPPRQLLHGRDLQLGQRRRAGRRPVVRPRAADQRARLDRPARPGGGDDLVEGVHPGTRAIRRRRCLPPAQGNRSVARLAAAADAIRRLLEGPAQPPHPVWVRLSGQAAEHPVLGDGRAAAAAVGEPAEPPERRLLRHPALAGAVPARPRTPQVPRRPRGAGGSDVARAYRDLDGGHSRAAGTARAGGPVSAAGPGRAGSAGRSGARGQRE